MRRASRLRTRQTPIQRPWFRPWLDILEDRLAPGDAALSGMALSLLNPDLGVLKSDLAATKCEQAPSPAGYTLETGGPVAPAFSFAKEPADSPDGALPFKSTAGQPSAVGPLVGADQLLASPFSMDPLKDELFQSVSTGRELSAPGFTGFSQGNYQPEGNGAAAPAHGGAGSATGVQGAPPPAPLANADPTNLLQLAGLKESESFNSAFEPSGPVAFSSAGPAVAAPDAAGASTIDPWKASNGYLGDWIGPGDGLPPDLQATGANELPAAFAGISGLVTPAGFSASTVNPDPGVPGAFTVTTQEYSFGDAVFTAPGALGESVAIPNIELTARVYAPTTLNGQLPVIVLLHGRHSTAYTPPTGGGTLTWPPGPGQVTIPSYRGYDYLGENLASHGYVVVSVSANGINARDNGVFDLGMIARAQLLQRHLDILRDLNATGTVTGPEIPTALNRPFGDRFVGHLDLQNIGTMGHSRGGEGVVRHFILNQSLGSPYGIKAVFALAPVDFSRPIPNGVPLGVLLPYNDGDVSDLQGVHFYDDARYNVPGDLTPKHTFYVIGAGHNFYNTVWTPGLFPFAGAPAGAGGTADDALAPAASRLSPAQVQANGRAIMSAFFRTYVGNATTPTTSVYLPFLKGDVAPPPSAQLLPDQYFASYHAPDSATFRRDVNRLTTLGNLTTNTLGGTVTTGGPLLNYTIYGSDPPEAPFVFPFEPAFIYSHTIPSARSNRRGLSQLQLSYANTATAFYQNNLPSAFSNVSSYYALQFRASLVYTDGFPTFINRADVPQDFTVTLTDTSGRTASTLVSDNSRALFYPPTFGVSLGPVLLGRIVQNTVRIPLSTFAFQGLDLTNVQSIRFDFNQRSQGSFVFSDLAFVDPANLYAGPFVSSFNPFGQVAGPLNSVRVTFNTPINPDTFDISDIVSFTGPGGTSVAVSGIAVVPNTSSRQFDIFFDTLGPVGTYTVTLGPDIRDFAGNPLDQNFNGITGESIGDRFTSSFSIFGPRVISATPTGQVLGPVSSVRLTFNKQIDVSTFTLSDIVSFTGPGGVAIPVTAVTPVDELFGSATVFDLTFAPQTAGGTYTLVLGPDIRDTLGNPLDQNQNLIAGEDPADRFTTSFTIVVPFGYVAADFPFEDFSIVGQPGTFTIHAGADDDSLAVNLGTNTFSFFGTTYTGNNQLFVSTNGLITFGSPNFEFTNTDLSNSTGTIPQPAIAPLWDDWFPGPGSPMVVGRFENLGDADPNNDRLVIEWNQLIAFGTGTTNGLSFQAILQLNTGTNPGNIIFNYRDVDTVAGFSDGASATVGIKDAGSLLLNRLLISFNSTTSLIPGIAVRSGRAIRITRP